MRCKAIAEFIMDGLKGQQLAAAIQQLDEDSVPLSKPSPTFAPVSIPVPNPTIEPILSSPKIEQEFAVLLYPADYEEVPPVVPTPELSAPIDPQARPFFWWY